MFVAVVEGLVEHTDAELDARLRELELERRRIESEMAAVLAVTEARRSYRADGHRRLFNYVLATLNCSRSEASRLGRVARLLDSVDGVGDALWSGRIGSAQVGELARLRANPRCGDRLAEFAPFLVDHAEHLCFDDFRSECCQWETLADEYGAFDDVDPVEEGRDASLHEVCGGVELRASGGDPITTEAMLTIFGRFVEREFERDVAERRELHGDDADAHPLRRTAAQRRFDALQAIFVAAASAPADARPPEPVVNLVGDVETFERFLARVGLVPDATIDGERLDIDLLRHADDLVGRECRTASGLAVTPRQLLQAALAGHVRRVVVDAESRPIDFGRARRLFTGAARHVAKLLSNWCDHPGCSLPAELCDVDHRNEWTDGGPTDQANADVRCGPHNRHKHRTRSSARRTRSGRSYTFRPDGSIILPVGERPPDFRRPDVWQLRKRLRRVADDPGWNIVHLAI